MSSNVIILYTRESKLPFSAKSLTKLYLQNKWYLSEDGLINKVSDHVDTRGAAISYDISRYISTITLIFVFKATMFF